MDVLDILVMPRSRSAIYFVSLADDGRLVEDIHQNLLGDVIKIKLSRETSNRTFDPWFDAINQLFEGLRFACFEGLYGSVVVFDDQFFECLFTIRDVLERSMRTPGISGG
jgi:hypothetical protein